jgi:hypothetical protein
MHLSSSHTSSLLFLPPVSQQNICGHLCFFCSCVNVDQAKWYPWIGGRLEGGGVEIQIMMGGLGWRSEGELHNNQPDNEEDKDENKNEDENKDEDEDRQQRRHRQQ